MDNLNAVALDCTTGPKNEQFQCVLKAHTPQCDVLAKAEQLIRVSAVAANREPRQISVCCRFDSGLKLTGVYTVQPSDIHTRGFLDNFLAQLKANEDLQLRNNVHAFPIPPLPAVPDHEFEVISDFKSLTVHA